MNVKTSGTTSVNTTVWTQSPATTVPVTLAILSCLTAKLAEVIPQPSNMYNNMNLVASTTT